MQELLAEKFGQKKLRHRINPDEAVAIGASLLAHNLDEFAGDIEHNIDIKDRRVIKIFTTSKQYRIDRCSLI